MFKAQKARHLYDDQALKKPTLNGDTEYWAFTKHDGWYVYYDCRDQTIRSRANRIIPSLQHYVPVFQQLDTGDYEVIIAEAIIEGMEFPELNGVLNRKAPAQNVVFMAHDYVHLDNPEAPYWIRYSFLVEQLMKHPKIYDTLRPTPLLASVFLHSTAMSYANKAWESGEEGIILKRLEAGFSMGKRNSDVIKVKEEVTLDLLVTGIEKGDSTGKYADVVGALICRDSKGHKHHVSGMTDPQRIAWMKKPEDIIGEVVEIKAMKILPCGSLREPRFKAIRHDKTVDEID